MGALANRRYLKMNGLGNEILIVDLRGEAAALDPAELRSVAGGADTRFDQMMAICDPRHAATDAWIDIYNTDGSVAGACGNGTRCVAWAMLDDPVMARPPVNGSAGDLVLATEAGALAAERVSETVFTVDMGTPRLAWHEIPLSEPFQDTRRIELQVGPADAPILDSPSVVSMGNPHAIFWVEDPDAVDLARLGPMLEHHPLFPERANISLAQVAAPDRIVLRVWERGAGLTRACGSAACAALVAAVRNRRTGRRATVVLPGGELVVEWRESDGHVLMTGPVEVEHDGVLPAFGTAVAAA